jgi:predicted dehydrogenase
VSRLRVGIIGCGKMGKVYAHWFDKNPHCTVGGLYNRTLSRAEELKKEYTESNVYHRWEDLISDKSIDIIGICTPSHEHLAQFSFAVHNYKHVLCEKPMANDIHQCRKMVDLGREYNGKYMVGFQMRFHPVIEKVNELLSSIGEVFHIDFIFGMYRPEITWRHKLIEGGGVLKELTSHLFDLCYCWVGELKSIQGLNRVIEKKREVEDYSLNIMEFKNGASGFISSNYQDRRSRLIQGNILGRVGQISFQFSSYNVEDSKVMLFNDKYKSGRTIDIEIPREVDIVYPGHLDSFKKEIDHFIDCILHEREPLVTLEDGLRALEIIDASYESTRIGKKIEFPFTDFDVRNLAQCYS